MPKTRATFMIIYENNSTVLHCSLKIRAFYYLCPQKHRLEPLYLSCNAKHPITGNGTRDCLVLARSSGNAYVSGAGGLRFKSRAGQIEHSVANALPPQQHFFESTCVARAQMTRRWAPQSRYTLRRNTANNESFDLIFIGRKSRCDIIGLFHYRRINIRWPIIISRALIQIPR